MDFFVHMSMLVLLGIGRRRWKKNTKCCEISTAGRSVSCINLPEAPGCCLDNCLGCCNSLHVAQGDLPIPFQGFPLSSQLRSPQNPTDAEVVQFGNSRGHLRLVICAPRRPRTALRTLRCTQPKFSRFNFYQRRKFSNEDEKIAKKNHK